MMAQLLAHLWGDYILQSDWMAQNKRTSNWACTCHCFIYCLPFILIVHPEPTDSWRLFLCCAAIYCSHFYIDRYGLARYLVWAKNWLGPAKDWYASAGLGNWTDNLVEIHPSQVYVIKQPTPPFRHCAGTGYPPSRPVWLATWLLIIADNTLHLTCNYLALRYL